MPEGGPIVGRTVGAAEAGPERNAAFHRAHQARAARCRMRSSIRAAGGRLVAVGRAPRACWSTSSAPGRRSGRPGTARGASGRRRRLRDSKAVDGKTLQELASYRRARGVFLRKIRRGPTETQIPMLPNTKLHRGDTMTIVGRTQDTTRPRRRSACSTGRRASADIAFVGLAHHARRPDRRGRLQGRRAFRSRSRRRAARSSRASCSAGFARFIRPSAGFPSRRSGS